MNKKMRELQARMAEKHAEATELAKTGDANDLVKAKSLLDEIDDLQKAYEVEERLIKAEKEFASQNTEPVADTNKADGFTAMLKAMNRGKGMTEAEKALITGTDATQGENYLIPEDVNLAIKELRKSYVSAKDVVTVESTFALSGSLNFEKGTPSGLISFDDGDDLAEESDVEFEQKPFSIKWKGKLIPVSRILAKAEKAGLMGYLNNWFVKNAIISENASIFTTLKNGYNSGTPKAVAGWAALKASITKDLDPSCLINGVIITNQSGFAALDAEVDGNGRGILTQNPAHPTEKLFQGLVIKVYSDAQLANIDDTHFPIIYGDTKAGAIFKEYAGLEFNISDQYLFGKNQNCLRVIEGYDVISADTSAYIYGSFSATV